MADALREKRIDAIALPLTAYWKVRDHLDPDLLITGLNDGKGSERYVALVHRDSNVQELADHRKSSACVLPIFFGKVDLDVVKRWSWETIKELNPQLSVQLTASAHAHAHSYGITPYQRVRYSGPIA